MPQPPEPALISLPMSADSAVHKCCGDGGWRRGKPVPRSITAWPVRAHGAAARPRSVAYMLGAGWQHGRRGARLENRLKEWERLNRWVCSDMYRHCVRAFVCMTVRMSTHSRGQTLTHKWNLATWAGPEPQLGSHGSWSCKPQWSCLNEAGRRAPSLPWGRRGGVG